MSDALILEILHNFMLRECMNGKPVTTENIIKLLTWLTPISDIPRIFTMAEEQNHVKGVDGSRNIWFPVPMKEWTN